MTEDKPVGSHSSTVTGNNEKSNEKKKETKRRREKKCIYFFSSQKYKSICMSYKSYIFWQQNACPDNVFLTTSMLHFSTLDTFSGHVSLFCSGVDNNPAYWLEHDMFWSCIDAYDKLSNLCTAANYVD